MSQKARWVRQGVLGKDKWLRGSRASFSVSNIWVQLSHRITDASSGENASFGSTDLRTNENNHASFLFYSHSLSPLTICTWACVISCRVMQLEANATKQLHTTAVGLDPLTGTWLGKPSPNTSQTRPMNFDLDESYYLLDISLSFPKEKSKEK